MGLIEIPGGVDLDAQAPRERVERMQRDNDATLQTLAQRGVQVDQGSLNGVRLALLIEHLLGDLDDERRLAYELAVQQRFAAMLAEIQGQVTRATLLQGVNGAGLPARGGG